MAGAAVGAAAASVIISRNRRRDFHKQDENRHLQTERKKEIKNIFDLIKYTSDIDKLKEMIKKDESCLEKKDPATGLTPLMLAIHSYKSKMAMHLIDIGVDINEKNRKSLNALDFTIITNDVKVFEKLYEKYNMNSEKENQVLLRKSIKLGAVGITDKLLDKGLDVNFKDKDGVSNFNYAIKTSNNKLTTMNCLLERGADIDSIDNNKNTALHYGAKYLNGLTVASLAKKIKEKNALNSDGDTPLHVALKCGGIDTIDGLVNSKVDVTIPDKNGRDALRLHKYVFKSYEHSHYRAIIKDIKKNIKINAIEINREKRGKTNRCPLLDKLLRRNKSNNKAKNMEMSR